MSNRGLGGKHQLTCTVYDTRCSHEDWARWPINYLPTLCFCRLVRDGRGEEEEGSCFKKFRMHMGEKHALSPYPLSH